MKLFFRKWVVLGLLLASTGCMQTGGAKTAASGSAGGAYSEGANPGLERCAQALGTMMVIEDTQAGWSRTLEQKKLGPTAPVLRLLAQQSNCFVVVERGRGMGSMRQERDLASSGELRENSNFGKGQMVSADFALSPSITFTNDDSSGVGGSVGGLIGGRKGRVLTGLSAGTKSQEASTLLTLIDNRSGVQLAAAEGSARNVDFGAMGSVFGSRAGGSLGGYSNTAEGKVIAAALTDAFNNIVRAVRHYEMQTVQGGLGTGRGGLQVQQ